MRFFNFWSIQIIFVPYLLDGFLVWVLQFNKMFHLILDLLVLFWKKYLQFFNIALLSVDARPHLFVFVFIFFEFIGENTLFIS